MADQQAIPTDNKRSAQGTITSDPTGPQVSLFKNPFKYDILKFPLDVGDNLRNYHWVKFTPCIQQKSEYQVKTTNKLSAADLNRAGGTSLAGSTAGFSALGAASISTGLGILSTAEAAFDAVTSSASNPVDTAKEFAKDTAVGAIGAIASGFIVNAITLDRKTRRAASSICLYMPDTVTNQLVNDYDQVSLTAALGKAGLVGQAGGSMIQGTIDTVKQSFGLGGGGVPGTGMGGLAEVGGMIAEKTGNFGAGITDVLLFSAGLAQNPQVELLFKNIQNREFLFDFKFAPRNKKEADAIREIIKKFRFYAAPEIPTNSNGRYFIPPSEFDIEFMVGQKSNKNLPRISTCVLQGIDVNYGSAGQWTAFQDGMPVEISMQLRFKEVEIMHKKLIDQGY